MAEWAVEQLAEEVVFDRRAVAVELASAESLVVVVAAAEVVELEPVDLLAVAEPADLLLVVELVAAQSPA